MVNHENKCMGCGGCEIVCPTKAIKIEMSQDGFLRPVISEKECAQCGKCNSVCPVSARRTQFADKAYSFKSGKKEVLNKSASGGFGYELSAKFVQDFPICSVEYDREKAMPMHKIAKTLEELDSRRNSIYLQSYTVPGFKRILELNHGIVFGSPCQISFLNNLFITEKKREQYLLIDFFCHGIPSYNVWKKYTEMYKIFGENPSVIFRSKQYGWGNFTIQCDTDNQTCFFDKVKDEDIFFRLFLENMVLNECCYNCPYHGNSSGADIRIGDYWGEKYKDDTEGITGLLVFTEKGTEAVNQLRNCGALLEESVDDVLSGQINADLAIPPCREKLLSALQSSKSLKKINSTIVFRYRLIRKINRMLGRNYI